MMQCHNSVTFYKKKKYEMRLHMKDSVDDNLH